MNRNTVARHRAFATFLVLFALVIASVVLVSLQVVTMKQASGARREVARVRAYWAARAGVEAQIAALTSATLSPDPSSPSSVIDELKNVARGEVTSASYHVFHDAPAGREDGPVDAQAKININTVASRDELLLLENMDESIADAILDWIDADDEAREFGAESSQYLGLKMPYVPRNAPFRSLRELELVAGVLPDYVRGEDWNLNNVIDPNEDDGDASWPPDNADGILDAGWSEHLTTESQIGPGYSPTGQARLDLSTAESSDVMNRLTVTSQQAEAILQAVANDPEITLGAFLGTNLSELATSGAGTTPLAGSQASTVTLSDDQLRLLLDETWPSDPLTSPPADSSHSGKLNINTVTEETLERFGGLTAAQLDAILIERQGRAGGFASIMDLGEVPSLTDADLESLSEILDVRSHVFIATSRGRDAGTGVQVEIVATLDRSTLPVTIRRLVVR